MNFFIASISNALAKWNIEVLSGGLRDIILPVGISFYTFQALGYTVDVYRNSIKAERNIFKYALFISFFPQLVAGPIERSGNLIHQLNNLDRINLWNYNRISQGIIKMLWGFFLKMVIADRVAVLVNYVFEQYYFWGTIELVLAAVGFALQIYCDFSSYSLIAIGSAQIMGITLMENFNSPYFATTIQDFWKRWHISLSTWFRDYVYIPLGGSHCSDVRRDINLLLTFLISGLWHGANWTFVVWGGIHGIYQIIGHRWKKIRAKINVIFDVPTKSFSYKLGQIVVTFILVDFAWIFFRADTIVDALIYIKRMVMNVDLWALHDGTIYSLGLSRQEMNVLITSVVILLAVDLLKYVKNKNIDEWLSEQCAWFQCICVIGIFFVVFIFGMYGPYVDAQQFIYFQF